MHQSFCGGYQPPLPQRIQGILSIVTDQLISIWISSKVSSQGLPLKGPLKRSSGAQ